MPEPANRAFQMPDEDREGDEVVARRMIELGIVLAGASPARAECLGSCLDGMVAALASIAAYAVIGIVLLVMLIRAKWRREGLWGLGVVAVLALGVPLVSLGWQAWKLFTQSIASRPTQACSRLRRNST